ncbi:MAG TPA: GAF domain-containing protein [Candidatus Brocadiia bacterium]|nr:GAF domain-containing protein [Candidatus Brocadiia bacterium]
MSHDELRQEATVRADGVIGMERLFSAINGLQREACIEYAFKRIEGELGPMLGIIGGRFLIYGNPDAFNPSSFGTAFPDPRFLEEPIDQVVRRGDFLLIDDVISGGRISNGVEISACGVNSLAALPMWHGPEVVGRLYLAGGLPAAFTRERLPLLDAATGALTSVIMRTLEKAADERRMRELAVIGDVSKELLNASDAESLMRIVAHMIQRRWSFFDVCFFMVDHAAGDCALVEQVGAHPGKLPAGYRQNINTGLVGLSARSGRIVHSPDARNDPRRYIAFPEEDQAGCELCIPIVVQNEVVGVLHCESTHINGIDERDIAALETLATEIAYGVRNSRLVDALRRTLYDAEQARKELEYTIQCASVGITVSDLRGVLQKWSPSMERMLGYNASEVVGRLTMAFFSKEPYDLDRVLEKCRTDGSVKREIVFVTRDGREVIAEETRVPLYDEIGNHVGYTAFIVDITERKQLEERILAEKKKLNDALDAMGAGVALMDRQRRIVLTNRTLAEWFSDGRVQDNKKCHELYACSQEPCRDCPVERAFLTGHTERSEQTAVSPDGRKKYFEHIATPIQDADGEFRTVLKLTQDVTQSAMQLEQLRLMRELSDSLQASLDFDRLLHVILTCVTAGHALGFNRAFVLLADEDQRYLKGYMAVGPASPEDAMRIWWSLREKDLSLKGLLNDPSHVFNWESPINQICRKMVYPLDDGHYVLAKTYLGRQPALVHDAFNDPTVRPEFRELTGTRSFAAVPLMASDRALGVIVADNLFSGYAIVKEHVQLLSTFANQSGLALANAMAYKRLSEQMQILKDTQDQLISAERLATVGNMATHVAHEIRNPLSTIGGFAQSIARSCKDDTLCSQKSKVRRNAGIIFEEAVRLEHILANVMDFTRPRQPNLVPESINDVLDATVKLMSNELKRNGVECVRNLDAALPAVNLDSRHTKQVFINLIKNAIEAMAGNGGTLRIATRREGDCVIVEVGDNGPGMSEDVKKQLFTPFFTTKKNGTGLGLSVCQNIISDHGAEMTLMSEPGKGTTFHIKYPPSV